MAAVNTFAEFFGYSSSGGDDYVSNDSIDYAGHLQLEHFGKDVSYVDPTTQALTTFRAIVKKERNEKTQTSSGWEEQVLRDVAFPSNDTTGRASVLMHAEMRQGDDFYQIRSLQKRLDFWHVTLLRINVGEVARPNRRGRS